MEKIVKGFKQIFSGSDQIIYSFISRIGPYITGALPAALAWYGMWVQFRDESPLFGIVIGGIAGIGIEVAGIKIIHTAIDYHDRTKRKDVKFTLLVLASLIFVGMVSSVIFFSEEAYSDLVRYIGAISPFLAAMAYLAIGIERSANREHLREEEKNRIANQEADLELESKRRKLQLELEMEERRLRAETEAYEAKLATDSKIREQKAQQKLELEKKKVEHDLSSPVMASSVQQEETDHLPFQRYGEFAFLLKETEDNSLLASKMGVSQQTIRKYKRMVKDYKASLNGG